MYPDSFSLRGKEYEIYEFEKPMYQNYIVFQMIGVKKEKNFTVLLMPDDYQIEIGNTESELILSDISVSKEHGSIRYDTSINEIVIQDNDSKYGTFILIQQPILLKIHNPLYVLNVLSLIKISITKESSFKLKMQSLFNCLIKTKSSLPKGKEQYLYENVKESMPSEIS